MNTATVASSNLFGSDLNSGTFKNTLNAHYKTITISQARRIEVQLLDFKDAIIILDPAYKSTISEKFLVPAIRLDANLLLLEG